MKTLRWMAVLAVLLSACLQKGGGAPAPGMAGPSSGSPAGTPEPSLDTPPIAGPSENDNVKPEVPIGECEEKDGINCPEVLTVSNQTLCTRTNTAVNPVITDSQTTVTSLKSMTAGGGVVDLKIWRYSGEAPSQGSPGDFLAAPVSDLRPKEADADPGRAGTQLNAKDDGTVTFRLVAGEKTGYYEFWVLGDLDTAFGSLTIEACGELTEGGGSSNKIDSFMAP